MRGQTAESVADLAGQRDRPEKGEPKLTRPAARAAVCRTGRLESDPVAGRGQA